MRALVERSRDATRPIRVVAVLSDKPARRRARRRAPISASPHRRWLPTSAWRARRLSTRHWPRPIARMLAVADRARRLHAHTVARSSSRAIAGRDIEHSSVAAAQVSGLAHASARSRGARAEHGATVHFVTEQLDAGPPVIQARVPCGRTMTRRAWRRACKVLEHRIYPLAVRWFCRAGCAARRAGLARRHSTCASPVQLQRRSEGIDDAARTSHAPCSLGRIGIGLIAARPAQAAAPPRLRRCQRRLSQRTIRRSGRPSPSAPAISNSSRRRSPATTSTHGPSRRAASFAWCTATT